MTQSDKQARSSPLILLCAGGTGGHMFPARALAEELLARGCRVALACDIRGRKYFDGMSGVDIHILSSGTYKPGLAGKIGFFLPLLKGYVQALMLVRRLRPSASVGFGGYPSAPPLWASQHCGVPTILHEQNAILGLANILLIGKARKLALSWRETKGVKPSYQTKTVLTGNPVRADIAALNAEPYPRPSGTIHLLIFGGSQGAAVFSDVIPKALAELPEELRRSLSIVQQARPDKVEEVRAFYTAHGMTAEVQGFFTDMPARLKTAHLLIARSGASTVAEVSVAGRPALFVPYPWNRDQQQVFNAHAIVSAGGGWMIEEKDLTVEALRNRLGLILADPDCLAATAEAAKTVGQPQAAKVLADAVLLELS